MLITAYSSHGLVQEASCLWPSGLYRLRRGTWFDS